MRSKSFIWIEEIIDIVEQEASCELYGLLKRPDEKFVTERAYDNPKFVEDMVRDVASRLNDDERIERYVVEAENFESIHNHSAYAQITFNRDAWIPDLFTAVSADRPICASVLTLAGLKPKAR